VNEYEGRVPFYHIDLYRLKTPSELEGIGFEENGPTGRKMSFRKSVSAFISHTSRKTAARWGFSLKGRDMRNCLKG